MDAGTLAETEVGCVPDVWGGGVGNKDRKFFSGES